MKKQKQRYRWKQALLLLPLQSSLEMRDVRFALSSLMLVVRVAWMTLCSARTKLRMKSS